MLALPGPVFLTYRALSEIDSIVAQWVATHAPDTDNSMTIQGLQFVASSVSLFCECLFFDSVNLPGANVVVQHTVWPIRNDAVLRRLVHLFASEVPCLYICDGHHRAQSAFNVSNTRRQAAISKGVRIHGHETFNGFLAVCFPHNQLKVKNFLRRSRFLSFLFCFLPRSTIIIGLSEI